jgi:hypothetical protein
MLDWLKIPRGDKEAVEAARRGRRGIPGMGGLLLVLIGSAVVVYLLMKTQ